MEGDGEREDCLTRLYSCERGQMVEPIQGSIPRDQRVRQCVLWLLSFISNFPHRLRQKEVKLEASLCYSYSGFHKEQNRWKVGRMGGRKKGSKKGKKTNKIENCVVAQR